MMKKLKINKEQYKRLFVTTINESIDVEGGTNRVNNTFKKAFSNTKVKNLEEEPFDIKAPTSGIPNSKIKTQKSLSAPEAIREDIFSPEFHQAIKHFIENIWLNPSQKGLDKVFVDNGITWGDIISYLTGVGILTGIGAGIYKVNNFFKRRFSGDKKQDMLQKQNDIEKMADIVTKDSESPWNKKVRLQGNDESGWKAKSKSFNPKNRKVGVGEASNYPPGTENDPSAPWNQDSLNVKISSEPKTFKPLMMNYEIAILDGPDGKYIFYYDDIRQDLPNQEYESTIDDIANYVNENLKKIQKGSGIKDFESGVPLVKIDEELKNYLIELYGKNKELVAVLQGINEMTSAGGGSSGAFTTKLGDTQHKEMMEAEDPIEEVTSAASSGSYVQPAIWAKDKSNWAASKKTQYPDGEMVELDPCTRLNNNKSAQNGKCSQGAVDNVVKTKKTKQSVISKSIYEQVAQKTGKRVEEVMKIIETKLIRSKSLS